MRPGHYPGRFYRPGNGPLRHPSSFNEAGAASPRKLPHGPASMRHLGVLGVASMRPGQLRPGNNAGGLGVPIVETRASMRPGQLRPGNERQQAGAASPRKFLTPDVRFNEAGAASPRKSAALRIPRPRASMRPGQLRPGNLHSFNEAGAASPRNAASMRPGQLRPGNAGNSMRPGQLRPGNGRRCPAGPRASMRPGQLRPGNPWQRG